MYLRTYYVLDYYVWVLLELNFSFKVLCDRAKKLNIWKLFQLGSSKFAYLSSQPSWEKSALAS